MALNTLYQEILGKIIIDPIINNIEIAIIDKYAVLTNSLALLKSSLASDSPSLFFKPLPKPKSKRLNQLINDNIVNHIPYFSEVTNPIATGTRRKLLRFDKNITIADNVMFFLTLADLSLLLYNTLLYKFLSFIIAPL